MAVITCPRHIADKALGYPLPDSTIPLQSF